MKNPAEMVRKWFRRDINNRLNQPTLTDVIYNYLKKKKDGKKKDE